MNPEFCVIVIDSKSAYSTIARKAIKLCKNISLESICSYNGDITITNAEGSLVTVNRTDVYISRTETNLGAYGGLLLRLGGRQGGLKGARRAHLLLYQKSTGEEAVDTILKAQTA